MLGHKIWLSAPESSNISVPYIVFLTLNWGYNGPGSVQWIRPLLWKPIGQIARNMAGQCVLIIKWPDCYIVYLAIM